MKKLFCVLASGCLALTLCACGGTAPTDADPSTTAQTQPITQQTQPTVPETEPPTTESPSVGYALRVNNHDQQIFDQPSYDGFCVGAVREAGVYTIVEEKQDDEGNLWGKLKSGAGWLDLGLVAKDEPLLLSASELTYELTGSFLEYGEKTEHSCPIIFHAYDTLTDVSFYSVVYDGEEFVTDRVLHTLPQLTAQESLVTHVVFAGDMTMFGISFTLDGTTYSYRISQNGRNNAIDLKLCTP